jgi:membrane dipeptidase
MLIVDAHEDLAWNALTFGRDYIRPVSETRALETGSEMIEHNGHTLLGWPEWIRGKVAVIFATLFAAPLRWREGAWETQCYSNAEEAERLYRSNLNFYEQLVEEHADKFVLIQSRDDLEGVLTEWEGTDNEHPRIGLVLLMEGADAVHHPDDLFDWYKSGVRIVSLSWAETHYAGGTGEPGPLTDAGRELLDVMAEVGMILDLSHLTEEGAIEALDRYEGTLIATHSNPLARVPHSPKPERHFRDHILVRIAERKGVIGTVLSNEFLKDGWVKGDAREAVTMDDITACIDHVCQVVGNAEHVGIGSDFDGGFGLDKVPAALDNVAELGLIGDALSARGYSKEAVEGILGGNWLRVLRRALPES